VKKYNLVCFYSEGEPNDFGLDLSFSKDLVTSWAKDHVDHIEFYTPKKLSDMGYEYHVKNHEECGLATQNPGMNNVGFEAWKPLIILLELAKLNEGDVLIYRDVNGKKYRGLQDYTNIKNIIDDCFDKTNFDFIVPRERDFTEHKVKPHLLRPYTKANVLEEFGENNSFVLEFPNCHANQMFFKKSKISEDFLTEWKSACENEKWINGTQYSPNRKDFLWSCNAQSILGVLIANWVRMGKHNIPKKYPLLRFHKRNIQDVQFNENYDYLKYLSE